MAEETVLETTIRAYAAAWAARDREAWLRTFATDATQEDPIGDPVRRGHREIGEFWDREMARYESIEIVPREIFVVGHEAAMVWAINGVTARGAVSFDGVDAFQFDDAGLISSVRAFWQRGSLHRQFRRLGDSEPNRDMTEEIEIAEYDTRWPARFATEAEQIRRLLDTPSLEIEHHGSTAVLGLAAKPVIDMLVAVDSIGRAEQYAATLAQNGYEPGDPRYRDQWPERIVVIRREDGARVCHVHLMLRGHTIWTRLIASATICAPIPMLPANTPTSSGRWRGHWATTATRT